MIPKLPSKKEEEYIKKENVRGNDGEILGKGKRLVYSIENKSYNQALDDCLPRIEYLEGLVEELGEALKQSIINGHYKPYTIISKYTKYKQAKENEDENI